MTTRGIRNNNPGNIDFSPGTKWEGELPPVAAIEPRFCRFESPEYGLRALMKLLQNYQAKHGIHTVRGLIERYAPSGENDTQSYIQFVADKLGVSPDSAISTTDSKTLYLLCEGIIKMENADNQPYTDQQFNAAYSLL